MSPHQQRTSKVHHEKIWLNLEVKTVQNDFAKFDQTKYNFSANRGPILQNILRPQFTNVRNELEFLSLSLPSLSSQEPTLEWSN
jgi:hypothetical protein